MRRLLALLRTLRLWRARWPAIDSVAVVVRGDTGVRLSIAAHSRLYAHCHVKRVLQRRFQELSGRRPAILAVSELLRDSVVRYVHAQHITGVFQRLQLVHHCPGSATTVREDTLEHARPRIPNLSDTDGIR